MPRKISVSDEQLIESLKELYGTEISAGDIQIVKMLYGLDDGEEKSLFAVARAFDITVERVRQINAKFMGRLYFWYAEPNRSRTPPQGNATQEA